MCSLVRCPGLLSLLVLVVGCSLTPSYKLTASTKTPPASKPPTCEFRVVNMPPQGNFEEIATLTPEDYAASDPEKFKSVVQADVCRVGGDVAITEVNGFGQYVRGTVLRKTAP